MLGLHEVVWSGTDNGCEVFVSATWDSATRAVVSSSLGQAMVHCVLDVQQRTVRRLSLGVWLDVKPLSTVLEGNGGV